ncbi:MAG TPA: lysine--tRNA ligase [Candidatus Saccharibacteria bacterium]|nr:lysine--tRNA ligase [Candidatus Saccharibacteria bacterium]HMT39342.1 lysine--tRNA ligase [Candidatus Saccharibacteria bacterium]
MANLKELRDERLHKLSALKRAGIDPYPQAGERTAHNLVLVEEFDKREGSDVKVVGRITSIRLMGGMCFIDITDESGKIQAVINKKSLDVDTKSNQLDFAQLKLLDNGDFIQASGALQKTNAGEVSVFAQNITFLAKSLRPMPDIHEGFKDVERRYRQRYIDLHINPEVKRHIEMRSKVTEVIRQFLITRGFIELETPVLQPLYGGASARPFTTYHHKLESDLYLRISNELYLKRAIVAGFERVFEFSRDFRNEGIDRSHNPEFTMLELYQAYANYEDLMLLTEQMISEVLMATHGQLKFSYQGQELNFKPPYRRVTLNELVLEETGINYEKVTRDELIEEFKKRKLKIDLSTNPPMKDLFDEFYKQTCREKITDPIFLLDYPAEMIPLAKRKKDKPSHIASMQLVCAGFELIKAYNELNDPIDQLQRLQTEQSALDKGESEEAQPLDYDYIRALEIGLPPTAGWGMGIDRFVSFLADQPAIKDVILFPTLRPEEIDPIEFTIDEELK